MNYVDPPLHRLAHGGLALVLLVLPLGGCLAARHGISKLERAPEQHQLVIDLPAVDLPAAATHDTSPQPEASWTILPADGWIHGFSIEVVDHEGRPLPDAILHHVKLMTPGQRELFMPIMLRVVGAGSETRSGAIPHYLGYRIQAGDSILATAMVHNPTDRAIDGVRIRVRLHYTASAGSPAVASVYPFFLHVTPPAAHSGYDLPPGRSERSWEATPAVAGRVLAFGGHIHRYGTELRFEDVTSGRVLWRAKVRTDSAGNVVSIPRRIFKWGSGKRLDPAHTYRVTAVYDNPTGDTLRDAGMGTIAGVFRPARAWPGVSRSDSVYVLDRSREVAGGHGVHGSHQHHH